MKIKIMHVLHSVGGVDVSLRLILENLDSKKYESIVIHGKQDSNRKFLNNEKTSIKDYKLPIHREIHLINDIISIYQTIKIIKSEKPDIIHAHSAKGGVIARAASIFFKITVFHTPQAYSYLSSESKLKRKIFLFVERAFKHINSILVASSESERQRGLNEVGYTHDRALLFNNSILPVNIEVSDINKDFEEFPDEFICTVGRPSYQKNIEMMVNVVKVLHEKGYKINLIVLGVGEYSPNIEAVKQLIKNYGLENNIFLIKWMERNKVFKIIEQSKLYISTARYEGLPYSIIESLSLGKACVVTNCDGNRDLVTDGVNGYVVEENETEFMANRIIELYYDDDLRKKFEVNSLNIFEENFNMIKNISKLEDLYNNYSVKK